jgi:hypothetical protein
MARRSDLSRLRDRWDEFYQVFWHLGEFWARRRDDGSDVHAVTAAGLDRELVEDFAARPVPLS